MQDAINRVLHSTARNRGLLLEGDFIEFNGGCSSQQGCYFGGLLLNESTADTRLHGGLCLKDRDEHCFASTAVLQRKVALKPCLLFDRRYDRLGRYPVGFINLSWLNLEGRYSRVHWYATFLNSFSAVRYV